VESVKDANDKISILREDSFRSTKDLEILKKAAETHIVCLKVEIKKMREEMNELRELLESERKFPQQPCGRGEV
jgi:hypothetical protein